MEEKLQESQIMICLICRQAAIIDGITSVEFDRGEFRLVVDNVPARVCTGCGEAYVAEEVAARLLQSAEEMYKAGMLDGHLEYSTA